MNKTKKYFAMALIVAMAFTGSIFADDAGFGGTVEDSINLTRDSIDATIGTTGVDDFSADGSGDVTFLVSEYTINNNDTDGYTITIDSAHNGYLLESQLTFNQSTLNPVTPGQVEEGDKVDYKIKITSDTTTPFDPTTSEHWGLSSATSFATYVGANNDAVSPTNLGLAVGCDVPDDGEIVITFDSSQVDQSTDDASMELHLVIPQSNSLFNGTFNDTITVTLANI
jgi:hypothetical protein